MARKKIVYVIVEGPSDDIALNIMFNKIFDKDSIYVEVTHGDITSDKRTNISNIIQNISDFIKNYALYNHYKKEHFKEIIHIIDTDGTYISDENVLEDKSLDATIYSNENIYTSNRSSIIERNARKKAIMNKLIGVKNIWGIPYRPYYMSSNLDHALYGKQNSSNQEKESDSYAFAKKYKCDVPGFLNFICKSDFSVTGDFYESWQYIKQNLNSLERHTNLGICFEEYRSKFN